MATLTPVQAKILAALEEHGPATGGELLKQDKSLIKGTVHTTLVRLETAGLVKGTREPRGTVAGHPRVFYVLTGHGERELMAYRAAEEARAAYIPVRR